ncbi:MAG TPA: 3-deoxy-D-manno-octulosonate 8-phosphate phosphatase [Polyangia bacterium]|nr:3-deoxy-D-manno-octulosonate 8-phosphate phosphatase [Polyangia bacterium]
MRGEAAALWAPLLADELLRRAARLRLVITDVDGVLTDGGVYVSERGEAMKRFSVRDGMGVERLRAQGIETAFLTRETSPIVQRRAEKLRIRHCYMGAIDKRSVLPRILEEVGVPLEQVAYIGDDVNDQEVMAVVAERGLVGAPLDAVPAVLRRAHHCCARPGGCGAFRDFAEWILDLKSQLGVRDADATSALDGQATAGR